MELLINRCKIYEEHGKYGMLIEIPFSQHHLLDKLKVIVDKDVDKILDIKVKREKRSLDANSALWLMLNKMAIKLRTTKDELYLDMLDRYGVFTHVVVKPEAVKRVMQEWRTVRELGKVTINGKTGIQLQCFYGSSQYNKEEFSTLLNGVIDEAKEIGIDFYTKEELNSMIMNWGEK